MGVDGQCAHQIKKKEDGRPKKKGMGKRSSFLGHFLAPIFRLSLPTPHVKKLLSPEGTLQSRYRRRSNCFYLCLILCLETYIGLSIYWRLFAFWEPPECFIPRRDSAQSRARRWSNCFYFRFYWGRLPYWHFQNHHFQVAFLKS